MFIVKPRLFDLNLEELHNYPFIFSLNRCNGSCNTPNDLSSRICIVDKTEDVNLNVFDMTPGIK